MMSDKRLLNSLPKIVQRFARRKMKGGYLGGQCVSYIKACTDKTATVLPTVLTEASDLIEVFVTIEADDWSVTIVAKKAKLNGSRLWSAIPADVLAISGVTLENVEEVATWLELP